MKTNYGFMVLMVFIFCITNSCKKDKEKEEPNTTIEIPARYLLSPEFNSALNYTSLTDQDGNTYKTIIIGTQTWMAENLKTTKFRDGSAITLLTSFTDWLGSASGAYCWYYNRIEAKPIYGAIYNWYAVSSGKLCPSGWHIPTDTEWMTLTAFLGGIIVAGGKMKETGTSHWNSPNTDATNSSGFTGLPGGPLFSDGTFGEIGLLTIWWSSTENNSTTVWTYTLFNDKGNIFRSGDNKKDGCSVRCIKD